MKTKIASLSITGGATPEPKPLSAENSALVACGARWEHMRAQVRGQTWSEAPEAMVADYARSVAEDLLFEYGPHALPKSGQLLAVAAISEGISSMTLDGTWIQANASVRLAFSLEEEELREQGVVMEVMVPEDATEAEAQQAVEDLRNNTGEAPVRMELDPIAMLPDADVKQIVARVERYFPGNDINILTGAAAVLLIWKSMEECHSTTFGLTLNGLHRQGKPLTPGQSVKIRGVAKLMEETLAEPEADHPMKKIVASIRKSKPQ